MITRVESEMSVDWMKENSDEAISSILAFNADYNNDKWQITVDNSRKGFVTLVANNKEFM